VEGNLWFAFPRKVSEHNSLTPYRIHIDNNKASRLLSLNLKEFLLRLYEKDSSLIILCIGTDRSTGDSLGPLVGSKIKEKISSHATVYGTLDHPVHAVNLEETINEINNKFNNPLIIAIDACLGKSESVGYISIKPGALQPGSGVNKDLPQVGKFHIIGVVNVGGFMEYLVLQNTRLSLVMQMAEVIGNSLIQSCHDFFAPLKSPKEEKFDFSPVHSE
jgi:putative sporulation protein YyaC